MLQPSVRKLDPREEHYWIAAPRNGLQLFLAISPPRPLRGRYGRCSMYTAPLFRRLYPLRTASMDIPGATPCAKQALTCGDSISLALATPIAIQK